jgi:hypothetical protein
MKEATGTPDLPSDDLRTVPQVRHAVDALKATSTDLIEASRLLIAESRRLTARWPDVTGL